jgi:hypothetical protein
MYIHVYIFQKSVRLFAHQFRRTDDIQRQVLYDVSADNWTELELALVFFRISTLTPYSQG